MDVYRSLLLLYTLLLKLSYLTTFPSTWSNDQWVNKLIVFRVRVRVVFFTLCGVNKTYREHSQWCWPQTVRPHQGCCEPDKCRLRRLTTACSLSILRRFWSWREKREAGSYLDKILWWHLLLTDSNTPGGRWQQVRHDNVSVYCYVVKPC